MASQCSETLLGGTYFHRGEADTLHVVILCRSFWLWLLSLGSAGNHSRSRPQTRTLASYSDEIDHLLFRIGYAAGEHM